MIYVNTKAVCKWPIGRISTGDAREDWAILRALSDQLGSKLPYDSLGAFAGRQCSVRILISRGSGRLAAGDAADIKKLASSAVLRTRRHWTSSVADFYFNQSDRARFCDHGRMLRAGARGRKDGGGVKAHG